MAPPKTDIDLYTAGTPNGHKVNCTVTTLKLNYTVHKIDIAKNDQKEAWYLDINPNGRIPAIVDKTDGRKPPKRIFEGAAIQLYLTAKYDPEHEISFPYGTDEYWEVVEWLMWMQSGIGPMQGQANHFYRYSPTKIPYAISRYQNETRRLYQVLEDRLSAQSKLHPQSRANGGPWVVGGKFTIADIAIFSWVNWAEWAGVETGPFPGVERWLRTIQERPAVREGCDIPEKFEMKEAMKTAEGEEEYAKHHSNWVMQGMEEDRERHE